MTIPLCHVPCPLCGTDAPQPLFPVRDYWLDRPEQYRVVRCQACAFAYLDPRPAAEALAQVYPPEFFGTDQKRDEEVRASWNSDTNRIKASYLASAPPGQLFEIGAYWGDFLKYMRHKGWAVAGCEPSAHPRNVFELDIRQQTLEACSLDDASVDAVVAWAVLEHVYNPLELVREIARVLKPKGEFVFNVPNFRSPGARWLHHEDYPRHVNFFTPDTVARLATACGLTVDALWFDDQLFALGSRGLLEYTLRRRFRCALDAYLRTMRSREQLLRRAAMTRGARLREAGVIWGTIRTLDYAIAPVVDWLCRRTGFSGSMTVRLRRPPEAP